MDAFGRFVVATGAWPAVMTHGDFHIENILAVDEHVSAIVDFEWAAGDWCYRDVGKLDYSDQWWPGFSKLFEEEFLRRHRDPRGHLNFLAARCLWRLEQIGTRNNDAKAAMNKADLMDLLPILSAGGEP